MHPATTFPPEVRAAYTEALRDPEYARAICEEYRATATIDREHDRANLAGKRRIECPLLVLWSAKDALDTWYAEESGPIALWQDWAKDVQGCQLHKGSITDPAYRWLRYLVVDTCAAIH